MTCPVQGCEYPAGTACTMAGCPGKNLRGGLPLSSPHAQGGGRDPGVRPHTVSRPLHMSDISQVQQ